MARLLRQERLSLEVANKRALILTAPDYTDDRGLFVQNYWPVVAIILERYTPAGVAGVEAVRLHLGEATPPLVLPVVHGANKSEYKIALFGEFDLRLRPATLATNQLVRLQVAGTEIPVLAQADLLATLDLQEIELNVPVVSAWLRHLVLRTSDLRSSAEAWPRPDVLGRIGALAEELGNSQLSNQIYRVVRGLTPYRRTLSARGVGTRIIVPAPLTTQPRGSGSPWLDRQAISLVSFRDTLESIFSTSVGPPPEVSKRQLVLHARREKTYDAYHNTTLEGYRISRDKSDAVVNGAAIPTTVSETERIAMMAVRGYSHAFDRVITLVDEGSPSPIDASLIIDLYAALFRPSVDEGYVKPQDLSGWRTSAVGLAGGWRHVPPNAKKVADLIEGLTNFLRDDRSSPLTRAVLAHLEFVTIHPFLDGNGRVARLLMNYTLLTGGYPWVTIRSDERTPYFRALERAQVEDDVADLARFLAHHLTEATRELTSRTPPKRRR